MLTLRSADKSRLAAAHAILEHAAGIFDARFSIRLWDGSIVPLGSRASPDFFVSISGPGVIGSILRRPTLDNLLRHYATGQIDFHGGDLIAFGQVARIPRSKSQLKKLSRLLLLRNALPFLLAPAEKLHLDHEYTDEATGRNSAQRNNQAYIQFHYDLSNEFYQLFLDPSMQYSCAYFTDWNNSLEQAQRDKLDMICRKLRLKSGERFLDIGCGWGGLICYAAQKYGVHAHGVTLSKAQFDFVQAKIREMGLTDRVTVELTDYTRVTGVFDKIASVGMFEHVGIANFHTYFKKLYSLLTDRGLLLNHAIARRAKANKARFQMIRPEQRWIMKHIFPGGELDHIGHTLESMEACRFEVHDVEGWREHYANTTKLWCQRLSARSDEAIGLVGAERYRMWVAYLAGVSFAFQDGSLRIFQTLASKHASKGASGLPPTRRDLYV